MRILYIKVPGQQPKMTDFKVGFSKEAEFLMLHCYIPLNAIKMQVIIYVPLTNVKRKCLIFVYENG